ncbi:thioredoxin TrxC [Sphingomonas sp. LB-2]|uniref:thioredoxin TrxC n=1 Tax=Sphingomonas caeni TaxID=2984949 RepID=UPI00223160BD|nr:thioredoxin TrxC [Sphingomonas caeni]MCW3845778.1 thioredoxin TrxC [Sphingomonas caeni]
MTQAPSIDAVVVACPHDGALNRVPRARLVEGPKCGTCGRLLFASKPVALDATGFERHVMKASLPVLVDFWAGWCGPCLQMAPQFDAAAARLEPRVRLAKLDTEAQPEIAGRYGIQGIPTMILFANGREVARQSGAMPASAIVQWAEQALRHA